MQDHDAKLKGGRKLGLTSQNDAPNSRHVFFYGLFMDMAALRARGVQPADEQIVTVPNHVVRLRAKAVLLEVQGGMAAGVLARITETDFRTLYEHQIDYREIQVSALTRSGRSIPAVTMVHRDPDHVGSTDPIYSARWHELTTRLNISARTI